MEEKKYKLTEDTIKYNGSVLHRIQALKDFGDVKKGDIGGWVECEANLSQEGNCWVYNEAKVYEFAYVYGNSIVRDNAEVCGNVVINNNHSLFNSDILCVECGANSHTIICGNAVVKSNKDFYTVRSWHDDTFYTWTRSNNIWTNGVFYGSGEEFISKSYQVSKQIGESYEKIVKWIDSIKKVDKYKITDEAILYCGSILHRIEALRDFNDVKKGDKGGWIACERNLSHDGNCWIYDNAKVFEKAEISGNAEIRDEAEVEGESTIHNNCKVSGHGFVSGHSVMVDDAQVCEYARVYDSLISGQAIVNGEVLVHGKASIHGDVTIHDSKDYVVFQAWWRNSSYFTWIRANDMWSANCFYGTKEEFLKLADEESAKELKKVFDYVEKIK